MIIESGYDLGQVFQEFVSRESSFVDPLCICVLDKNMRVIFTQCLDRPFENELEGVATDALDPFGWYPFVAIAFRGDVLAAADGRTSPWQDSLDQLIIELAVTKRVLLAYLVYGDDGDEEKVFISGPPGFFHQMVGYDFVPEVEFRNRPNAEAAFIERSEADADAAFERLEARRG